MAQLSRAVFLLQILVEAWILMCERYSIVEAGCGSGYLHFPEGDQDIYIAQSVNFSPIKNGITICFWLKREPFAGLRFGGTIFSFVTDGNSSLSLHGDVLQQSLVLILEEEEKLTFLLPTEELLSDVTWDQFCLVLDFSSGIFVIYINGQPMGAQFDSRLKGFDLPSQGSVLFGHDRACIGCNATTTQFYGDIFRFTMWGESLDERQVFSNYEIQARACECITGDVHLVVLNVRNNESHTERPDNYLMYGPWDSCKHNISKTTEPDHRSVTTRAATANGDTKGPMRFDIILYASLGLVVLILLGACGVFILRRVKTESRKQSQHDYDRNNISTIPAETALAKESAPDKVSTSNNRNGRKTPRYISEEHRRRRLVKPIPKIPTHGCGSRSDCGTTASESYDEGSPVFERNKFEFKGEHIYAEIHPKYIPVILQKDKQDTTTRRGDKNLNIKPGDDKTERPTNENLLATSADCPPCPVYYSMPPHDGTVISDAKSVESLYELPLDSTFINAWANGEL